MRRFIVHDLSPEEYSAQFPYLPGDTVIAAGRGRLAACTGCYQCWTVTPGQCVLKDDYAHIAAHLYDTDLFVLITRCTYGGYSPDVKNVFDRSLGNLLPFFTIREDKRQHHTIRGSHRVRFAVYFYGRGVTPAEQATARAIVTANARNIHAASHAESFFPDYRDIVEVAQ